jgi:hypothetical protein
MITIPTHKPAELVEIGDPTPQKLHIASFGEGGVGKTRFGVTAPGLGVIPLNGKCRATVERARQELCPDKKIYFPKADLLRHANPMALAMMEPYCENKLVRVGVDAPKCCARHYYRWHVNRVKDAIWTMAEHPDIKTIMIDDGTQLYEDILYAHYGRANRISEDKTVYGPPNQEMIDLINSLQDVHLIIVHQAKDEYKGKTATGRDTVKGFREVGFYVNVLVEFSRDVVKKDFYLSVRLCQDNAGLHGDAGLKLLRNDDITFAELAMKIFGDDIDLTEYL